ncbi:MAG: hypothetical protein QM718_08375 [Steroidobacteraceae bacterium]
MYRSLVTLRRAAAIIPQMRRFTVYLTVVVVIAISLVAGWIASDWPVWCARLGWCHS